MNAKKNGTQAAWSLAKCSHGQLVSMVGSMQKLSWQEVKKLDITHHSSTRASTSKFQASATLCAADETGLQSSHVFRIPYSLERAAMSSLNVFLIQGICHIVWVCLKMGYTPNYSHLVGIMISKTIGFRGTNHFQTQPYRCENTDLASPFGERSFWRRRSLRSWRGVWLSELVDHRGSKAKIRQLAGGIASWPGGCYFAVRVDNNSHVGLVWFRAKKAHAHGWWS